MPPMMWSSEIWQKSLYLRNSKHCILYVGNFKCKNVQVEIKYSLKASTRDVKTIVENINSRNCVLFLNKKLFLGFLAFSLMALACSTSSSPGAVADIALLQVMRNN